MEQIELSRLYSNRFSEAEAIAKNKVWEALCTDFFQERIDRAGCTADIGAGYCEFINNIASRTKLAVDKNPDTINHAYRNVAVIDDISKVGDETCDTVFVSNLFEHMATKEELTQMLQQIRRILKPEGRLLILQPNIKYTGGAYWDFYDHHIALTEKSLCEGLLINGFQISEVIPRFLPYTTKSALPKSKFLVRLYLKLPFLWKLMGAQTFVLARKEV